MENQGVAVVTGAARGIRATTATRLARDGLPWPCSTSTRLPARPLPTPSAPRAARPWAWAIDVTDAEQVEAGVARVADELGPPVVLVNSAGIIRDNLIFKMTEGDWDAVMAVPQGRLPHDPRVPGHMTAQKYGRIVNLSSSSAQGNRGQANYSAAKARLQGFTKTLAIEPGRFGVTANAVAPGFIQTDMTAATAERIGVPFEGSSRTRRRRCRCSGSASRRTSPPPSRSWCPQGGFVSGQVIYVAGGPLD